MNFCKIIEFGAIFFFFGKFNSTTWYNVCINVFVDKIKERGVLSQYDLSLINLSIKCEFYLFKELEKIKSLLSMLVKLRFSLLTVKTSYQQERKLCSGIFSVKGLFLFGNFFVLIFLTKRYIIFE